MLIDVNKWIDKNGSFDEAGGLDLVRHGYEWIRRMRKFENKADRHTFQKVFGNKRGNELWDCFLEVGKSIFILEDSYFLINDRNILQIIIVIYSLRIYAVNYCSGISITTLCHISRKVNIILQANI